MKPIDDKIIVRLNPKREKVGSIYIPDKAQDIPVVGLVVKIGPEVKQDVLGRLVVITRYSGTEFKVTGDPATYVCLRAEDVLFILDEGERIVEE